MRITTKAVLLFGVVAVIPAVLPLPIVLPDYADALLVAAQNEQLLVAKEAQTAVDDHVGRALEDGRMLAAVFSRASRVDPDQGAEAVKLSFEAQRSFDVARLVVLRGDSPRSTLFAKPGADKAEAPEAVLTLLQAADDQPYVADFLDPKRLVLVFALERTSASAPKGYLVLPLYLQPIELALESNAALRLKNGAELFVVDAERKLVAAPPQSSRPRRKDVGELCTLSLLSGLPSGPPVGVSGVCNDNGGVVGAVQTTANLRWAVVIAQPKAVVLSEYEATRRVLVFAALGAAAVAMLLALLAGRGVTRPVLRLVDQARRIGTRGWERLLAHSGRSDELGELETELLAAGTGLAAQEKQLAREAQVRSDLSRFLSPELVERAVSGELDMRLGGKRQEISVLFADVVAFTPLAEKRPAEETVAILNELFGLLTEIVFRHGGFVDKFIGDAVMAVFGAPAELSDHADKALACAEDMMRFMEVAAVDFEQTYKVSLRMSIGVNSGEAVVGNIGSERRMDYTAIGDVVNVAARLETVAQPNQVLVGEGTRSRAQGGFELRKLGSRRLVGREDETVVYELVV